MYKTIYHKEFDIEEHLRSSLSEEIEFNSDLYEPLKTGFGQYPSVSNGREIIVIKTLTDDHDSKKNIRDLNFVGSSFWKPISKRFPKTIEFVNDLAKKYSAIEIGKVMYAKIPPGGTINFHTDSFPLYSGFIRAHIPIISEANGSDFYTEYGDFKMYQGGLFFYDTKPMHTTKNNSRAFRTHLIIDLLVENRTDYFEDPYFYYEKVKTNDHIRSKLSSDEFQEIQSKLGTLVFVLCHDKKSDETFFLWNSKGSKEYYLEQFKLYDELDVITSGEVHWKESYSMVRSEIEGKNPIILRKDYDFKCD